MATPTKFNPDNVRPWAYLAMAPCDATQAFIKAVGYFGYRKTFDHELNGILHEYNNHREVVAHLLELGVLVRCKAGYRVGIETGDFPRRQRRKARKRRNRKSISAKLRWTILNRDAHTCVYCGRGADAGAVLHIDHRVSVANGGATDYANLVTACQDCNLGKGARNG